MQDVNGYFCFFFFFVRHCLSSSSSESGDSSKGIGLQKSRPVLRWRHPVIRAGFGRRMKRRRWTLRVTLSCMSDERLRSEVILQ